jgi:hypothetical protein
MATEQRGAEMEEHYVLSILETLEGVFDDDGYEILPYEYSTFLVSTRKLEDFKRDHSNEYRYVETLIENFLKGATDTTASRKFSFGDTPDWFECLAPDEDCKDPIREVSYTIHR